MPTLIYDPSPDFTPRLSSCSFQVGIEIDIPENSIQRVGDFKLLSLRAEQVRGSPIILTV